MSFSEKEQKIDFLSYLRVFHGHQNFMIILFDIMKYVAQFYTIQVGMIRKKEMRKLLSLKNSFIRLVHSKSAFIYIVISNCFANFD